ncbi:MAG: hypothetical protein KAW84_01565 [Thermoplasmata archaeon]|nr:hypothetical protein [Thermoplasmata archaeon]
MFAIRKMAFLYSGVLREVVAEEGRPSAQASGVLDFSFIVPLQTFKELSHTKKISKGYKESIENRRAAMRSIEMKMIGRIALRTFPRDMQSGRQYRRKGIDKWVLHKVGDI